MSVSDDGFSMTILRQSIIDCYKVIMDNKIKKDATNPKHVESSPGDLRVENITKREEQIPKTSNSKKKRDKKKKKKTMTSPETQTTLPAEVKKEPAPMTKAEKSPQAQPSKVEKPVVPAPPKVEKPTPPIPIKTEKTVPTPKTVKKQTATTVIDEKPAVESSTAQAVNDSDEWENIGARRTQKTQSDMVHRVHKCKIPSRLVGRLIGKSGASINEIRTRTNTTIDVDTTNKNANDECDVTVRGFTKDAKIVFSFIAEIISNPDRATTAILDDIERNKSLSPVSFTVVSNTKDRMNFHSAPKYESYTRESFTFNPPINHDTPSSQPDVLKSYITNNRPIIRVDDSQNSLIINQDPRPRVIQPTATVQSIPASNVVWSTAYEPKITTSRTNLTAPMDQLSVGSSVTFAQATSNARSFSQCPGTGRSSSPSATVNKFECPILHTIKTKFNIGITIDEDLWNLTSAQDQPFPATVAEYLNNIKPQQDEDQDQDDLKDNQPNDNSSSLRTFQTRPLV
ncbi:Ankyrin repeat domain-containing protein 17 [Thelohanellus kitauei]|uniref:Ankyrin repeat domain-containing protein 17 n=1 Tax=Thelohanellus kitauei TaxID=669202 RepID=A0A0C2N6B6_THEKT|nr:Ankyrin repeat domain-containing protein 17 [Thelohanellus kitauei]